MYFTESVPKVPLQSYKRTKIIATIGPATDSYELLYKVIDEGANGLRMNFSHGTHEERVRQIPWIRKAAEELGKPVAIIQDLQGPKVRLGDFEGEIKVETGQVLRFAYEADYAQTGIIPTQYDLGAKMQNGERLFLFDGKVRTVVTEVKDGVVYAEAHNSGTLVKRKGINLPDTDFHGDIITEKDMDDIRFGAQQDIDYVALSFVQDAEDVNKLREILTGLNSRAKIISKIETNAAVENIEAIVQASDAVMVARGDLAIETLTESVPVVQREVVGLGQKYAKPTIVATQMLMSMVETPEPSRAEVSDVATAVFMGADGVMLSEETANGKYPVEAVKMMKRIVLYSERNMLAKTTFDYGYQPTIQNAIAKSVLTMAGHIDAKAIVAETRRGSTALQISSHRPHIPVIAVTSEILTAQQLSIVYGVKAYIRPDDPDAAFKLTEWLLEKGVFQKGDIVIRVSGHKPGVPGMTDTIKVRAL